MSDQVFYKKGCVWLVGAGPGAPDMMTKRGCDLLQKADVVVYDALILPETLEIIPEGVKKIYVGKRAGAHSVPQEEIQKILIREARQGKRVVRLKGGDPFVFGRGGEEAMALAECGIPCEVVPGVTSAVAVPEAFGIPVTHRGLATSFTVITGHGQAKSGKLSREGNNRAGEGSASQEKIPAGAAQANQQPESPAGASAPEEAYQVDYEALVRTGGTLIFLMGLSAAQKICRGLMDAGMAKTVPAAALSKGTTAAQRMVLSTVGCLADDIRAAELTAPAVLVVGEVCALAPELTLKKPKAPSVCGEKVTVVVTRQAEKAGAFSERIRAMGADVCLLPAIRIQKPGEGHRQEIFRAFRELCGENRDFRKSADESESGVCWLIFTSANGVEAFFELLLDAGMDLRRLLGGREKKFAAVGPKTAEALRQHGIPVDLVPEEYTGAALGEALRMRVRETECWFFGAARTDGGLEAALASGDIPLKTVPVYETVSAVRREDAEKLAEQIARGTGRFIFTFTSASCVRNLAEAMRQAEISLNRTVSEQAAFTQASMPEENVTAVWPEMPAAEILDGQIAVCIGEKTAGAAAKAGMKTVVAKESTEESMLEEIRRIVALTGKGADPNSELRKQQ
ncbi:MAG: uroporphyrinogen-III C-methyltransferase [Lachnospiraceae bacterium]|nr:uroporphyrinogen-III C-methyltransferase [Lachnospiraceae bacterium]